MKKFYFFYPIFYKIPEKPKFLSPLKPLHLILTYRNRDVLLVKNCLESLFYQDFFQKKDNENKNEQTILQITFLDYGSEDILSQKIQEFIHELNTLSVSLGKYHFIHYVYYNSKGQFWNKSHAFNLAFGFLEEQNREINKNHNLFKKGGFLKEHDFSDAYFLLLDVDLVLEKSVLDTIWQKKAENQVFILPFYRLPKNISPKNAVENVQIFTQKLKNTLICASGNIFFHGNWLKKVGGFDEFYRFWGMEDNDFLKNLENAGAEIVFLEQEKLAIFHQWHFTLSQILPKGWQEHINDYFKQKYIQNNIENNVKNDVKNNVKNNVTAQQKSPFFYQKSKGNVENRISYHLFLAFYPHLIEKSAKEILEENQKKVLWKNAENPENPTLIYLKSPFEHSFLEVTHMFSGLEQAKSLIFFGNTDFFQNDFQGKSTKNKKIHKNDTFFKKIILFFNALFKKIGFSYRFIDVITHELGYLSPIQLRDWVFYFVLLYENVLLDYYFFQEKEKFCLVITKK